MKTLDLYDYEKTVSEEKRTSLGIVYTPEEIVSFINAETLRLWVKPYPPKFLDPCCGTGVFIADMAKKVSKRYAMPLEEVYRRCAFGEDIDADAIKVANRLVPLANFKTSDSLRSDWSDYDIVVTNPPYIRVQNLSEEVRSYLDLHHSFCKGDTDLYMAFLEKVLDNGAISGIIVPNSWIKNKSADAARKGVAKSRRVSTLIDFQSKKVFENASTYTSILVLGEEQSDTVRTGTSMDEIRDVKQEEVFLGGCVITSRADLLYYREVQKRSHSLFDICDVKTGLATLSDAVFCLEVVSPGPTVTSVKKRSSKSLEVFELESEMLKPCIRAGDITKNIGKQYVMLYPYDSSGASIDAQEISRKYPLSYSYLSDNMSRLKERDKGKDKGYTWTEYGRSQGLQLLHRDKLVFATMIKDRMVLKACPPGTTFVSGYCFIKKRDDVTTSMVQSLLTSNDILKWIKIFGKNFGDDWYGISKQTFKEYRVNL